MASRPARTRRTSPTPAYAGQHWDDDLGLSYAQQRWYSPGTGRFLSEDPVGWNAERLGQPTRGHAFGYAAGNPLMWTDPEGLDVGQPESTSARAQEDQEYQAVQNERKKDNGSWASGCLAGLADLNRLDAAAFEANKKSAEWLSGYMSCKHRAGGAQAAYQESGPAKAVREAVLSSEAGSTAVGCVLGGGAAIVPGHDVSDLPPEMQKAAEACQFGVGAATAVVTAGEAGVSVWRGLKNMRPPPRPALAGVTADGRAVAAAGKEASAAEKLNIEARAKGGTTASVRAGDGSAKPLDPVERRVKLRKKVREEIAVRQPRNATGDMIDPNTGEPLRPGEIDVGHKRGHEWRKRKELHRERGSTRAEVVEAENNPDLYHLEDRLENQSHRHEE